MLHMYIDEMVEQTKLLNNQRSHWMGLLARAPIALLEQVLQSYTHLQHETLKPYETVAFMVQARTGSSGQRFNMGEVSVGRMILKLQLHDGAINEATSYVGVAYIKGANERQTYLAALADALLQTPVHHDSLSKLLLEPIESWLSQERQAKQKTVQATQVEFFTVARENNAAQAQG